MSLLRTVAPIVASVSVAAAAITVPVVARTTDTPPTVAAAASAATVRPSVIRHATVALASAYARSYRVMRAKGAPVTTAQRSTAQRLLNRYVTADAYTRTFGYSRRATAVGIAPLIPARSPRPVCVVVSLPKLKKKPRPVTAAFTTVHVNRYASTGRCITRR